MTETSRASALPHHVVAVDSKVTPHFFKLKARLDGSLQIKGKPGFTDKEFRKPFIMVLHPDLVFKRDGRVFPKDRKTLEALARDLFPFKEQRVSFAAKRGDDQKPHFYALTENKLRDIRDAIQDPGVEYRAVLVGEATQSGVGQSIQERLAHGPLSDLSFTRHSISHPAFVRLMVLGLICVILAFLAINLFSSPDSELREKLIILKQETQLTADQYSSLNVMQQTIQQLDEFNSPEYRTAMKRLLEILNQVPRSAIIEKIRFAEDQISVSGYDNNAESWLGDKGLKASQLDIRDLPQLDAFTALFQLKK